MRKYKGRPLSFIQSVLALWLITVVFSISNVSAADDVFHIGEPADWIVVPTSPAVLPGSESLAYKGSYYQLYDRQINAIDPSQQAEYSALELLLTNSTGVSRRSQIQISIDANYEHLIFHELGVIRKGKFIDKLGSTKIEALRSENNMQSLIYDGTSTITAILNDVRVGDILRYAYTVEGSNPVFGSEIEIGQGTQYKFNINRIAFTMHTSIDQNMQVRTNDVSNDFALVETENNGIRTFSWSSDKVKELKYVEDEPAWTAIDPYFTLSTIEGWEDVVNWMLPHYSKPETQNKELADIAAMIERRHDTTEAKIGAALQWVQREVRYFGIELGTNSHNPSSADTTLNRRFGDCKDKTVLLIAILDKLGVDAQPALVDTDEYLRNDNYAYRIKAFNHVIVHLELDGKSHFIDPTLDTQNGDLGHFREPDFGKALIIAEGENALRNMNEDSDLYKVVISKKLVISDVDDTEAQLTVNTRRSKYSADYFRGKLQDFGYSEMSDRYLDYYREYYNRLISVKPMKYDEYPQNNSIVVERYAVDDLWSKDEDNQWSYELYMDEIRGYLNLPDTPKYRDRPYRISHPIDISETSVIQLPESARNIAAEHAQETVSNDYFTLRVNVKQDPDSRLITFEHTYKTHGAVVPANAMAQFEKDINRAWEITYFDIYKHGLDWDDDKEPVTNWSSLLKAIVTGSL